MDKKHCSGCRDDFYNGHNDLGVTKCWSLKDAKLIPRKAVHINHVPPWNQPAELTPSCYRRPQFIFVNADRTF